MSVFRKTVESLIFLVSESIPVKPSSGSSTICALLLAGALLPGVAEAQVNVTTYQNDIGRTGQNLSETTLNLSNVNASQFGKLFSQQVDGQIYAQPLYLSGITVNGATHNVVFVATENDSVYAFDANSNGGSNSSPLWKASLLSTAHGATAGATTVASSVVGYDIQPQIGITGTPVIDPVSGTLYVVSATWENGTGVQRLHALDVTSGAEKFGGPVVITATIAGTGNGSSNGSLTFDPVWENQRPGLLLLNGIVYVGFASHGDNGPWHGWIFGYNAKTLAQTGAYCASPNGTGSGFWMSGQGLAADQLDTVNKPFGRMFVPSGNGDYNATKPYTNNMDYGDTHLALDLTNGSPTVSDEFTTNQQATLDNEDGDVGSGGLMVIPTQTTGSYPHLLVQVGKAGTLFLLNRDNMGGYNTTADQAVQEQVYTVGEVGAWSSPAYWNGTIYYWGRSDYLKAFKLTNGLVNLNPTESSEIYGYPGATPTISANGTSQGIVWSIDSEAYGTPGPAILQAHNASSVSTTLYSSATNPGRDQAGNAVKFTVPTVANGMVYVGTASELDFYGLLAGATQASAPVITPGTESFNGTISVSITDSTPGSSIYYTTNGTAPNTSSTLYTGPISVSSTETISAVASASGYLISSLSTATYTDLTQATAVVFSLPTGTYTSAQSLTLSDSTTVASIYYTTDGSTPTASSTLYTGPITINTTETISAIAIASGVTNSPVISNTYTLQIGATGIDFNTGFAASAGSVLLNGSTQLNDSRLQLTDGLAAQAGSAWFATPVNIQQFTTDFTFQLSNPVANGVTFTIQNSPQKFAALGFNGSGLGYYQIPNSVAIKFDFYTPVGNGKDSTGLYINGANPTTPAIDLSGTGINLASDDEMAIHLVYNGTVLTMTITDMVTSAVWTNSWTINIPTTIGSNTAYVGFTGGTGGYTASQKILTWSFVSSAASSGVATPTFTPAGGTYATTQTVTIGDSTSGATIYYTTNGTTPTTSSAVYASPISVSATETLEAIAVVTGSSSSVGSASYTIAQTAATPTFSVAAGTYSSTQSVSLSDTTPGATIYYTTNGTTPTTSSTVYSGPISVSTTETIEAIAVATGYSNSAVAAAKYTITSPAATPTFSVAAGTYASTQSVTLSDTTSGATIYYTTNGTTPTTSSAVYAGAISVSTTETLEAIAVASGYSTSGVAIASYTINAVTATPVISPGTGSYTGTQSVTISDPTTGATIYYTTNGTSPTTSSTVYSAPISVTSSETIEAIAVATGYSASPIASSTLTIVPQASVPKFNLAAGTYATAQSVPMSCTTPACNIYYTTNGTIPTTKSNHYAGPIAVSTSETIEAISVATGYAASPVVSATYNIGNVAATPTFSVAAGTYSTAQLVSLSDTTSGATVYYTTNGTIPTTSSAVYSGAISVSSTETIEAIAVASGYSNSAVASATYTINPPASTPTFSVAAGTYTTTQSVTLGDATTGATIYYTTNGTSPTTSSTVYSGPISVSATETIEAIAVATGYTTSAVASATYTISAGKQTAAPTFIQAPGTYTASVNVQLSDTTAGAVFYYTTNGTTPTTSSTVYSSYIPVLSTETLNVIAVTPGSSASPVTSGTFTIAPYAALPVYSLASGTYTTTQTVSITSTTPGAVIYYTINGGTPTTGSTKYTGPLTINSADYIQAIAVAPGYTNSFVAAADYIVP